MCAACAREYADPDDRRFHAQPVCCPACGPRLRLETSDGKPEPGDPIARTAALIASGAIVAIKGLGGYHLAASALDARAIARCGPQAPRGAAVRAHGRRPRRRRAARRARRRAAGAALAGPSGRSCSHRAATRRRVAEAVAPGSRLLGLMLPYTPLHHLLAREIGEPFVLTSGNLTDEPIAYRDDDARERLAPLADYRLVHDRQIHDTLRRLGGAQPCAGACSSGGVRAASRRGRSPCPSPHRARSSPAAASSRTRSAWRRASARYVSHHIGDLEQLCRVRVVLRGDPPSTNACSKCGPRSSRTTCTRSTCRRSTRSRWPIATGPGSRGRAAPPRTRGGVSRRVGPRGTCDRGLLRRTRLRQRRLALGRRAAASPTLPTSSAWVGSRRSRCRAAARRSASRGAWRLAHLDAAFGEALPGAVAVRDAMRRLGLRAGARAIGHERTAHLERRGGCSTRSPRSRGCAIA